MSWLDKFFQTVASLTQGNGSTQTIGTTDAQAVSLQTNGTERVNLSSAGAITIESGTATTTIGAVAAARTINVGTGAAQQTITVGSTTGASSLLLQSGTGDVQHDGRARLKQATQAMADADQTLSAANARANVIITTGAITADRVLTMGAVQQGLPFFVDNRCTGAFGVTVKGATGTGIKIANVKGALLYCDGTNIFRLSADVTTTV